KFSLVISSGLARENGTPDSFDFSGSSGSIPLSSLLSLRSTWERRLAPGEGGEVRCESVLKGRSFKRPRGPKGRCAKLTSARAIMRINPTMYFMVATLLVLALFANQ